MRLQKGLVQATRNSLFLEVIEARLASALSSLVGMRCWSYFGQELRLGTARVLSNLNQLHKSTLTTISLVRYMIFFTRKKHQNVN